MAGLSDIRHELCLALSLWNGADPILKERMFGLTGPAGQPRRGRQGVLVVPRRPAEPRPAAVALPLPAGRVPVRAADRRERPPRPRRLRVRAARHRRVRRRPLLDRRRHLRQGVAHRRARRRSPSRTTAPTRPTLDVLPTLWFRNTWRVVGGRGDVPSLAPRRRRASSSTTRGSAATGSRPAPAPDGTAPDGAVLRQRDQHRPAVRRRRRSRRIPKDGINDHVVAGRRHRQPRRSGARRRRGGTGSRCPAAAGPSSGCGSTGPTAGRGGARSSRRVRRRRRAGAGARPTSSTPPSRRPASTPSGCGSSARRAPGWSGASRCTRTGSSRWLDGDPGAAAAAAGSPQRTQRRLAPPRRLRRARHARPVGVPVVRGVGPRVPRRRVGPPRPGLRQVPAGRAAPRVVPAPQRRAARVRVELRRRQPAGPRPRRHPGVRDRRRRGRRVPRAGVPEAARSTSPGGSTARTPTATTSSAAGSSGSTTSARSTARTCPPGCTLQQADGTAWMAYYSVAMLALAAHPRRAQPGLRRHGREVPRAVRADHGRARASRACTTRTTGSSTTGSSTRPATSRRSRCRPSSASSRRCPPSSLRATESERLAAAAQALRPPHRAADERRAGGVADPRPTATTARLLVSVVSPDQLRAGARDAVRRGGVPVAARPAVALEAPRRRRTRCPGVPGAVIDYEPAESRTAMYGGNSNWRGPVWFPVNYLVIRALLQYDQFFGADFTVEYPTGSGKQLTLARDRRRPRRPAGRHLAARRRRPPAGVRRHRAASRPTRRGRTTSSSSSTSTATSAPASAPRTRPAGPPSSPT